MRPFALPYLPAVCTLALLVAFASSACSDDDLPPPAATDRPIASPAPIRGQPEPVQALAGDITQPQDGVLEVRIQVAQFVNNRLAAKVGEAVTLRVTNEDSQPHNLRIAGPDGEYETEDDALTQPSAIEGGESGELIFAPAVPGNYTFRCDFHPGSMGGQVKVASSE